MCKIRAFFHFVNMAGVCMVIITKQASSTLIMLDSLQGEIHSPTRWEVECEVECVIVIETTILLHLDHRCWN